MMELVKLLPIVMICSIGTVHAEYDESEITKEIANRDLAQLPVDLITLCDESKNKGWCKGYFSAAIISFKESKLPLCYPINDVGRHSFDGVWTITKSWLYRQPKDVEIKFYTSIKSSLTEHNSCTR